MGLFGIEPPRNFGEANQDFQRNIRAGTKGGGGSIAENLWDQLAGPMKRAMDDPQPTLQMAEVDPETKRLLARQMASADMSEGDIAKGWLGNSKQTGLDSLSAGGEAPNALGGNEPAGYREALGRRSNKKYEQDFNKMERQAALDAKAEKFTRAKQMSDIYARKQDRLIKDTAAYNDSVLKRESARNQVINSSVNGLMGTVGSVMGMVTGGMGGGGGQQQQQNYNNTSTNANQQSYGNYNYNERSGGGSGGGGYNRNSGER